ncbi:MAG: glycoside hydrolase family 73 protein [Calditrichia bacterium]
MGKHWFSILIVFFVLYVFLNKDISIQVNFSDKAKINQSLNNPKKEFKQSIVPTGKSSSIAPHSNESKFNALTAALPISKTAKHKTNPNWKAADFRNLTFILAPDYARRKGVNEAIVEEKLETCRKYIERFAPVAISEMKKFGVPASITLAQGLLESDAGDSKLTIESNNHFGIKCRTKCRGCTCRNYADDDVFDMFRVFDTAWESYREHSILLCGDRYKHLKKLGTKDYKNWAKGLKKSGYATDKKYDEKLIQIIESLDLYQFDN